MGKVIEGEWKDFVFKLPALKDYPKILAHLRKTFYIDEPLCKLKGFSEELARDLDNLVLHYLDNHDLSFFVEEKSTGIIAGARISYRMRKDSKDPNIVFKSPDVLSIFAIIDDVSNQVNLFEKYKVEEIACFMMASVDPIFRGQGLATEMYKRSFDLFRAKGIPMVTSMLSSPFTRKIATNFKFEEIYSRKLLDYKMENGEPVMPNAEPDQIVNYMVKKL